MYSALGFSSQNISIVVLVSIAFQTLKIAFTQNCYIDGHYFLRALRTEVKISLALLSVGFCKGTQQCLSNQLQQPQSSTTFGCSTVHTTDYSTRKLSWARWWGVHQPQVCSLVSGPTSSVQEQSCALEDPTPAILSFTCIHWQAASKAVEHGQEQRSQQWCLWDFQLQTILVLFSHKFKSILIIFMLINAALRIIFNFSRFPWYLPYLCSLSSSNSMYFSAFSFMLVATR